MVSAEEDINPCDQLDDLLVLPGKDSTKHQQRG